MSESTIAEPTQGELFTFGPPGERERRWILKFEDVDKGDTAVGVPDGWQSWAIQVSRFLHKFQDEGTWHSADAMVLQKQFDQLAASPSPPAMRTLSREEIARVVKALQHVKFDLPSLITYVGNRDGTPYGLLQTQRLVDDAILALGPAIVPNLTKEKPNE